MRFRRMMVSVFAFWVVAMLLATSASAQFRLRVEAVGTGKGLVISDGVPGDGDPDGNIMATFVIATGESDTLGQIAPAWTPGPGEFANMHLNQVTISSSGAATVRLTLEDTGRTDQGHFLLNSQVDGNWAFFGPTPPGSSVSVTSWVNTTNVAPVFGADADYSATGGMPGLTDFALIPASSSTSTQTFNSGGGALFSGSATPAPFTPGAFGYALWTDILIQFGDAGGTLTFDQFTTVTTDKDFLGGGGTDVPEPGSLMLIAAGVAVASRMRRRKLTRA